MENGMDPRYPIGKSPDFSQYDAAGVQAKMAEIAKLPADLARTIRGADPAKLGNTYRDGGWTALQVLHHIGDSHINAYCRFKFALTEDRPTIKPYEENAWAALADYDASLIEAALGLIEGLHAKWVFLMVRFSEADWKKCYYHPESKKDVPLYHGLAIYAWHGRHHLRHIETAITK
jgi:hypothetical protein